MDSSSRPEDMNVEDETQSEEANAKEALNPNSKGKGKSKEAPKKRKASSSKAPAATEKVNKTWSAVWDDFTRVPDNKDKCKCHHCSNVFSCPTSSGTSNLTKHLKFCKQYQSFIGGDQAIISQSGESLKTDKVSEEVWRVTTNGMMVLGELPLSWVEGVAWKYFCDMTHNYNMHSRRTATRDIYKMFVKKKAAMKVWLTTTKQRVSLTTNIWKATTTGASYMVITLHFIDRDWHMRKLIIAFKFIPNHKGVTISRVLLECMAEWGIEKIFTITCDNASANTSALKKFHREFSLLGSGALVIDGEFMHMRCAAHIINLIVQDGLHQVDASVKAIRNAVDYVRSSTNRLNAFDQMVDSGNLTRGSLPMDIVTRWNSTHLMLTRAMKYKPAFYRMEAEDKLYNSWFQEDEDGKSKPGPPTATDWNSVERLVKFLSIFYKATLMVSASTNVCSYKCYGAIMDIEKGLIILSSSLDNDLNAKAEKMRDKFDKYWGGLDDINMFVIAVTVFDPRKKMHFAQLCFEELHGKESIESKRMYDRLHDLLVALFKEYGSVFSKSATETSSQSREVSASTSGVNIAEMDSVGDDMDFEGIEDKFNVMVGEKGLQDVRDELEIYLKEKVEKPKTTMFGADTYDVLSWWRRNCGKYPVLSEIARDLLAMQVSSVASESAFSTSGRILEPSRSCLSHYTLEVLMCTEQWMKAEIQHKEKGAQTNAELLQVYEVQDDLEKEFAKLSTDPKFPNNLDD